MLTGCKGKSAGLWAWLRKDLWSERAPTRENWAGCLIKAIRWPALQLCMARMGMQTVKFSNVGMCHRIFCYLFNLLLYAPVLWGGLVSLRRLLIPMLSVDCHFLGIKHVTDKSRNYTMHGVNVVLALINKRTFVCTLDAQCVACIILQVLYV